MILNKKERALLVNGSNYSATLKEFQHVKRLRRCPMRVNGLNNMLFKFQETGQLGVIPGTRGPRLVNPEKVKKIDEAIVTTSSSSGAPMLTRKRVQEVWLGIYLFSAQLCIRRYPYKI